MHVKDYVLLLHTNFLFFNSSIIFAAEFRKSITNHAQTIYMITNFFKNFLLKHISDRAKFSILKIMVFLHEIMNIFDIKNHGVSS